MTPQDFIGPAKRLGAKDITVIAGYLGCHVATVRAILAVESAGWGFDFKNRPKMLFEPHVFYRELGPGVRRETARAKGVAYPKLKLGQYPSDSYPRLFTAMAIDETAALRSASWGMHQGMGFNHAIMGFDTVQEYVKAMTYSESAHLYAMARFIVSKGLQKHLRALNWSSFAKVYNGSLYAKHGYHTRLKDAYDARPASERFTPAPASESELNMLLGLSVPPEPREKPEPVEVRDVRSRVGPVELLLGAVFAAGAAIVFWLWEILK